MLVCQWLELADYIFKLLKQQAGVKNIEISSETLM